jgi:hypothetical protein
MSAPLYVAAAIEFDLKAFAIQTSTSQLHTAHPEGQRERPDEAPATITTYSVRHIAELRPT